MNVGDVTRAHLLQGAFDETAELHAREIGGAGGVAADLVLEPADLIVVALDLGDNLLSLPNDLETELDLVPHLVEHVAERLVRGAEQLTDVILRTEDGAEGHRDDRVLAHHRLVHELVREDVLARRVVDDDRRVADHRGEVVEVDGVHALSATDADRSEFAGTIAADDAVDVFAAFPSAGDRMRVRFRGARLIGGLVRFGHCLLLNSSIAPQKLFHTADPASARSCCRRHGRRREDHPNPRSRHTFRSSARAGERGRRQPLAWSVLRRARRYAPVRAYATASLPGDP